MGLLRTCENFLINKKEEGFSPKKADLLYKEKFIFKTYGDTKQMGKPA
jgi:hypothetical protein